MERIERAHCRACGYQHSASHDCAAIQRYCKHCGNLAVAGDECDPCREERAMEERGDGIREGGG